MQRQPQHHGALDDVGHRPRHDKDRDADAERRQNRAAAADRKRAGQRHGRKHGGDDQALRGADEIAALPAQQRTERHCDRQRNEQRPERGIEKRRPDRDLVAGQRFQRQRIKRTDEYGGAGADQEQIVEDQRALARDRREQASLLEQRRAPGIERQRAADEQDQNGEDENAAPRIGGEGVHRREHAGADQKRADQRQRERQDGEQDGPNL